MTQKKLEPESLTAQKARFYARVRRSSGCWLWLGPTDLEGYGHFHLSRHPAIGHNTRRRAHRVAYEMEFGALSTDVVLRHTCDNPRCVNPAHLTPGTHQDNIADRTSRKREARGERNGNTRLSDAQIAAIRARRSGGAFLRVIAAEFSVSTTHIKNILAGRVRVQDGV